MHSRDWRVIIEELDTILDTVWLSNKYSSQSLSDDKDVSKEKHKEQNESKKIDNEESKPEPQQQEELNLYVKNKKVVKKQSKAKVDYITAPKKPTLQHYRAWEKAFKPLKVSVAHRQKEELDIEKTVEWIAQTDIFQLLYKKEQKKLFNLTLLIDTHHSMEIFEPLLHEFCEMIEHYGVFDKIESFYIDGKSSEALFYRDKALHQKVKQTTILGNDNNLILILSNCISPAWRSNSLYQQIDEFSKHNLCSIVQMLPRNMWLLTTLQQGHKLTWKSKTTSPKNSELSSKKEFFYFDNTDEVLKVPVIAFEHHAFRSWSGVVMGQERYAIAGVGFNKKSLNTKKVTTPTFTAQERLDNFLSQASSIAKQLSAYLANNHVSFEIARIIQDEKLNESTTAHLAEVFLGGIIEKTESSGETYYDFYKDETVDIRNELKVHIAPDEAWDLLKRTSKFVSDYFDSASRFSTMVLNPNSAREIPWDDNMMAFARIGIDILKRKGGMSYQEAIVFEEELDKVGEEEPKEEIKIITPTTKRFMMGSEDAQDREKPQHEVIINYDFEIAKTPVTVGEFRAFVEDSGYITEAETDGGAWIWDGKDFNKKKDANWKNPNFKQTDEHPVVCVSWNDAQAYINWLNEKTDKTYRLPTEAEWEFSCRAGTETKWHFGDDESELEKYAWYGRNDGDGTKPVGTKESNQWGLYDMHGNVWEWCQDDFEDNYNNTPRDGREHIMEKKEYKSFRGGSWNNYANYSRSAFRYRLNPTDRYIIVGFRLLRTLP